MYHPVSKMQLQPISLTSMHLFINASININLPFVCMKKTQTNWTFDDLSIFFMIHTFKLFSIKNKQNLRLKKKAPQWSLNNTLKIFLWSPYVTTQSHYHPWSFLEKLLKICTYVICTLNVNRRLLCTIYHAQIIQMLFPKSNGLEQINTNMYFIFWLLRIYSSSWNTKLTKST